MIEHAVSFITSRTDHPFVMSMFVLAAFFAIVGILVETVVGNGAAAGFLVIYAMMAAVIGVIGYAMLYTLKLASILREQTIPR